MKNRFVVRESPKRPANQGRVVMAPVEERIYKSLWHLLIAGVGLYEFKTHKTRLSKVLSVGLIVFHLDATVCDALDVLTTPQRLLIKLRPKCLTD